MADKIYFYNKKTYLPDRTCNIEQNFNINITIDGSKDSAKVVFYTYQDFEVEPYTIALINYETHWIVKRDSVKRYENENGFFYEHEMQLVGLIELLNARDLTDCGFNQKTYTIQEFLIRLVALSNFEQPLYISSTVNIDLNEVVPYVKTFENYTLLSAIREFLDGYNCSAKLFPFVRSTDKAITRFYLNIIPKTGDLESDIIDVDEFTDILENKNIDSNSFGAKVISNAENVISTEHKRFPTIGSTRLSANEFEMTGKNAILRLPSNVFRANWLKIFYRMSITFKKVGEEDWYGVQPNLYVDKGKDDIVDFLTEIINTGFYLTNEERQEALELLHENEDYYVDRVTKLGTITLYDGNKIYNNGNLSNPKVLIKKGANVPYIPEFYKSLDFSLTPRQLILVDKDTREMLSVKEQGIYWERGSDVITGFGGWDDDWNMIRNANSTDLNENIQDREQFMNIGKAVLGIDFHEIYLRQTHFACDYIPMSNIKVSVDNIVSSKDIKLYNQNGKLTDSVALSKLVNSYSKEISSDKITRYKGFYDYQDTYKVGQRVNVNGEIYVVNNVSLTYTQNEDSTHYIDGEFTMCKQFSIKSIMTNPNTNIREYGIPQTFNIKRKQIYKDYFEIATETDTNADSEYIMTPSKAINLGTESKYGNNHVAIFSCYYDNQVDGSYYWYYQLETTRFTMEKMYYEIVDFKDNNIIGYSPFSTNLPFDISKIFVQDGLMAQYNTPVSYVNNKGKVRKIDMYFVDQNNLLAAWNSYAVDNGYTTHEDISLYNYSVFIPQDIYDYVDYSSSRTDAYFMFEDKDALEVPVIEYCCQVEDGDDVVVGDRILMEYDNCVYLYAFAQVNKNVANKLNATLFVDDNNLVQAGTYEFHLASGCTLLLTDNGVLSVTCFDEVTYNTYTSTLTEGNDEDLANNKDLIIVRYAISKDISLNNRVIAKDLIAIVRNPYPIDNKVILHLNHYVV